MKSGMCPTWRERSVGNGLMVIVEPKTSFGALMTIVELKTRLSRIVTEALCCTVASAAFDFD